MSARRERIDGGHVRGPAGTWTRRREEESRARARAGAGPAPALDLHLRSSPSPSPSPSPSSPSPSGIEAEADVEADAEAASSPAPAGARRAEARTASSRSSPDTSCPRSSTNVTITGPLSSSWPPTSGAANASSIVARARASRAPRPGRAAAAPGLAGLEHDRLGVAQRHHAEQGHDRGHASQTVATGAPRASRAEPARHNAAPVPVWRAVRGNCRRPCLVASGARAARVSRPRRT